jgi:hypothetical protein
VAAKLPLQGVAMAIEQDIKDLREDFRALKARMMGHELVMATTLAELLKVANASGSPIDIEAIAAEMSHGVEAGATAIERNDPMGRRAFAPWEPRRCVC